MAFQACFTCADDAHRLWFTIESMNQNARSVGEYYAEFETVISQISKGATMEWVRMHFKHGLDKDIRHHVSLNAPSNATLDELATLGQHAYNIN